MDIVDVVAACDIAYRHNRNVVETGDGLSLHRLEDGAHFVWSNQTLVFWMLGTRPPYHCADSLEMRPNLIITDAARQIAKEMISSVLQGNLISLLKGEKVADFKKHLLDFLEKAGSLPMSDAELLRKIGMVVYLPQVDEQARQRTRQNIKCHGLMNGHHLDKVGGKLISAVTILKCFYSNNFQCYFVSAYTADQCAIRFSSKTQFSEGETVTITGRIKDHVYNSWSGEPEYPLTKLSHVKQVYESSL